MQEKNALIIFTRLPKPGETKTRLEKVLTKSQCAQLHIKMLEDLNETSQKVGADLFIAYTPNGENIIIDKIFENKKESFPQEGADIWDRMYFAMEKLARRGYHKIILIGADIPEMDSEHLNEAFCQLNTDELVITPTEDGGYCLIGSKIQASLYEDRLRPVFNLKGYTGDEVCLETIRLARKQGLFVYKTKSLLDLDEGEDLEKLVKAGGYNRETFSHTLGYLKKIGY